MKKEWGSAFCEVGGVKCLCIRDVKRPYAVTSACYLVSAFKMLFYEESVSVSSFSIIRTCIQSFLSNFSCFRRVLLLIISERSVTHVCVYVLWFSVLTAQQPI